MGGFDPDRGEWDCGIYPTVAQAINAIERFNDHMREVREPDFQREYLMHWEPSGKPN